MAGRGREQLERLAQCVELELAVDPVPDLVRAARVAGQAGERLLAGHRPAGHGVGGLQVGAIGQDAVGHEGDGVVQQAVRAVGGHRLAGVALVPDPHVAVVVVPAGLRALRQRHGGRGDHAAAAAGQPGQHRVAVPAALGGQARPEFGNGRRPGRLGGQPRLRGLYRDPGQRLVRDLQHQVVKGTRVQGQVQLQGAVRAYGGVPAARPPHPERAAAGRPYPTGLLELAHPVPPEAGPQVQDHPDPRGAAEGDDPAQHHRGVRVARVGQCLTALGETAAGDPAAAPDQRAALVVPAPHEARFLRGHGVDAGPADQAGEDTIRIPPGRAQPGEVAARPDQRAPFPVRHQRILTQHVRGELVRRAQIMTGHALLIRRSGASGYPSLAGPNDHPPAGAAQSGMTGPADQAVAVPGGGDQLAQDAGELAAGRGRERGDDPAELTLAPPRHHG